MSHWKILNPYQRNDLRLKTEEISKNIVSEGGILECLPFQVTEWCNSILNDIIKEEFVTKVIEGDNWSDLLKALIGFKKYAKVLIFKQDRRTSPSFIVSGNDIAEFLKTPLIYPVDGFYMSNINITDVIFVDYNIPWKGNELDMSRIDEFLIKRYR